MWTGTQILLLNDPAIPGNSSVETASELISMMTETTGRMILITKDIFPFVSALPSRIARNIAP